MFTYDILVCVLFFSIVGVIDDVHPLTAFRKLSLQLMAGIGFILLIPQGSLLEGCWLILWIIVITNAFNLIDGMDGLAISYACVVLSWSLISQGESVITWTMLGACLGFLPFNIYKAKFYLGDSGSHALGSAIGYLTVPFVRTLTEPQLADLVIVTLPLADILFVTITRNRRGSPVTTGGTDHIAHRLARLVGSTYVVPVLISFTALLAFFAVYARDVSIAVQIGFIAVIWADAIFLAMYLERRTRRFFSSQPSLRH